MTDQHPAQAEEELSLPIAAPGGDAPQDGPEAGDDPDQTVAVVHEGRSYQVPKALKGALMRHADYTRKTQELAQQRKIVAESQAHMVEGGLMQMLGLARLHALDRQIQPFADLDWGVMKAQNPQHARMAWQRYAQLKAARDQTAWALQAQHQAQVQSQASGRAAAITQGRARLHQDISDWSPQTAQQILQAGKAHGFSEDEVHSVTDPRMILVLNKARLFDEQQQRQAQARRLTAAHDVKPAVEVGAAAAATGDPSRMSTAEWMRWRAGQLRRRN